MMITHLWQGFRRLFKAFKNILRLKKRLGVPTLGLQVKGDRMGRFINFSLFFENFQKFKLK